MPLPHPDSKAPSATAASCAAAIAQSGYPKPRCHVSTVRSNAHFYSPYVPGRKMVYIREYAPSQNHRCFGKVVGGTIPRGHPTPCFFYPPLFAIHTMPQFFFLRGGESPHPPRRESAAYHRCTQPKLAILAPLKLAPKRSILKCRIKILTFSRQRFPLGVGVKDPSPPRALASAAAPGGGLRHGPDPHPGPLPRVPPARPGAKRATAFPFFPHFFHSPLFNLHKHITPQNKVSTPKRCPP